LSYAQKNIKDLVGAKDSKNLGTTKSPNLKQDLVCMKNSKSKFQFG